MAKQDDHFKKYQVRPELEAVELRLLFSAGLEGVLAAGQLEIPPDALQQTVLEQTLDQGASQGTEASGADVRVELIFVDTDTPEYQSLLSDLLSYPDDSTRYQVFELDNSQDGISQISAVLRGYENVDAVHILSHGRDGAIDLGSGTLDNDTLTARADLVQSWGNALTESADILIYGCNLAASEDGQTLVDNLAALTGADIAASADLTGNSALGGDWELEYTTGLIETDVAVSDATQTAYTAVLATAPDGAEFQVNTTTTNDQRDAQIAMDASGNYVVVWESAGQDGSGLGIYGQRFDAAGNPLGTEFQVNTTTSNDQRDPSIAMDDAGNFVVVWESAGQDGSGLGVYGQRFDAAANKLDGEFRVTVATAGNQQRPSVAMNASGSFVVAWDDDGLLDVNVYSRIYDAAGTPQSGDIQVSVTLLLGSNISPYVAMDDTGNFVVTWEGPDALLGLSRGAYIRMYDAAGTPQTGEMQVNTSDSGVQSPSGVAMDTDGDIVVVWEGVGSGDSSGVFARLYDNTGTAKGGNFRVNNTTSGTQGSASVDMDAAGNFVVTWSSSDGSSNGIYARRYDATGTALSGEFLVNTTTASEQTGSDVAMTSEDDFAIVWQSNNQDGSGYGIFGQRYVTTNPVITLSGGTVSYTEDDPPVVIDGSATVSDVDSVDFDTGVLTIDLTAGGTVNDRLAINNQGVSPGQIGISGSNVTYGGVVIGTFVGGTDGMTPLVITLNASADLAAVQALVRNITYQNVSHTPNTGNRTVRFVLTDGDGGTSDPQTESITVTAVNDAPVGVPVISGTATEDQVLTADTTGISDADGLGAFSYQWYRDGSAIVGATGVSYTLGDADVGALITVEVSYTDGQGNFEVVTGNAVLVQVPISYLNDGMPQDPATTVSNTTDESAMYPYTDEQEQVESERLTANAVNAAEAPVHENDGIHYQVASYKLYEYHADDLDTGYVLRHVKKIGEKGAEIVFDMSQLLDLVRMQLNEIEDSPSNLFDRAVGGIVFMLSAGFVSWIMRNSAIAASMVTSVPLLKGFDPLPLLKSMRNEEDDDSQPDEPVENLFEGHSREMGGHEGITGEGS